MKVLQQKGIRLTAKLKIYKTVVLSSLLYGCETWTLYRRHIKQLEQLHMRSLRSIMSIRWQDKISNLEVLERVESQSIESVLIKAQLRWTGHVVRMEDHRIPKQLLYGEVRYKDTPKSNLKWLCVKPRDLETLAAERKTWRSLTYSGAAAFKKGRQHCPQAARDKRHRAALSQVFTQDHQCPTCGRCCASVFGLQSHMRSHR